jgi:hypothetical protein
MLNAAQLGRAVVCVLLFPTQLPTNQRRCVFWLIARNTARVAALAVLLVLTPRVHITPPFYDSCFTNSL